MLALFVKIPTTQRLRKIRSFSADSKYSADHSPLLRFPHPRWSRLYSSTHISPIGTSNCVIKDVNLDVNLTTSTAYHTFIHRVREKSLWFTMQCITVTNLSVFS